MKNIFYKTLGNIIGGAIVITMLTYIMVLISKLAVISFHFIHIEISVGEFAISFILMCILFMIGFVAIPKNFKQ